MDRIKIAIPTLGRAASVMTEIEGQILVVDKKEEPQYREFNPSTEILICPNFKRLGQKRNWILDYFGGEVFMADDDILEMRNLNGKNERKLTPKEASDRIQKTAEQAKDVGAFLFGFNNNPTPKHYNPMKPFALVGFINGCNMGILKDSQLRYTEKVTAGSSHYVNLLNAYINRFCFIDKRFCLKPEVGSTFIMAGGQTAKRTMESEKLDCLFLRKTFGESIVLKKSQNATKRIHPYQRQIKFPY